MRFRIKEYYNVYRPQVWDEEKHTWRNLGLSSGYPTISGAKFACVQYKEEHNNKIVEEFEL